MNKMFRFARVASPAALLAYGAGAHAAMPAGVEAALSDLTANASTIATTILLAIVAVYAIKFIRRGL